MATRKNSSRAQGGFTLLELLVAMAVTLLIMGATFDLVTRAQTASRREPALADRQSQIRIAMDRLQEDITKAGYSMGPFTQVFTAGLNATGQVGVRAIGDATLGGGKVDALELRMQTQDCPQLRVSAHVLGALTYTIHPDDAAALGNASWQCYKYPGFVLGTFKNGNAKWAWRNPANAFNFGTPVQPADAASQLTTAGENSCAMPWASVAPTCPAPLPGVADNTEIEAFSSMDVVRYEIANDTDGTPALFRSTTGGLNAAGVRQAASPTLAQWQLVARGIEDMQIRYMGGPVGAAWADAPPTVVVPIVNPVPVANYNNIVRRVEVTLWARVLGQNQFSTGLQGETTNPGNGVVAVRGMLTTVVAPRSAEATLLTAPIADGNRWQ